jgi:hypothetical protein
MLAGLLVVILGALAGWYFFLRGQNAATTLENAGRGLGSQTPAGSPFGTGAVGATSNASSSSPAGDTLKTPQLWHIATTPSAGISFATSTEGMRVRYVERSSGYVFEADPQSGQITRLTNTLMPKIYEVVFGAGNRVYERSLDASGAITTFAGTLPLPGATSSQALTGTSLARGIESLSADQRTGALTYLLRNTSGIALMRAQGDGTKPKQLFSSVFTDWRFTSVSGGRVVLVEKAADGVDGYAYDLKSDGALGKLVGPLSGLTYLPKSGSSAALFGTSAGNGLSLFAQAAASSSPVRLPVHTFTDKCVWSPGQALIAYCAISQVPITGNFLNAWYRGEVHTPDALWRIDAGAAQVQLIYTPPGNTALDMKNLVMDETGTYIAFVNNADGSPWLLRLDK